MILTFEEYKQERHCYDCNERIYFDKKCIGKNGNPYPLEYETGSRHRCQQYLERKKHEQKRLEEQKYAEQKPRDKQFEHRRIENLANYRKLHPIKIERHSKKTTENKASGIVEIDENTTTETYVIERRLNED